MSMRTPCSPQTVSRIQEEIKDFTKGFDFLKEHVIVTDSNANIIYANAGVTQATGFSCDEVIGKNPADVWGGAYAR